MIDEPHLAVNRLREVYVASKTDDTMLTVELKYLVYLFAVAALIALSFVIGIFFGPSAHLPEWAAVGGAFAVIAGLGLLASMVWFRHGAAHGPAMRKSALLASEAPQPRARIAPAVVTLAILVCYVLSISSQVQRMIATHWQAGLDSFAATTLIAIFLIYVSLRPYLRKSTTRIDPITQRTREAIAAAYELPTPAERRAALQPIQRRGFIRLALLASEIPLIFILMPRVGLTFALLGSFAIVGGTFLLLHRRYRL